MRAYQFREQARNLLKSLSGKYALFFLPSFLSIFSIYLTLRETLLNIEGTSISVSARIFPLLISLLVTLFSLSAGYTVLEVIRGRQRQVSFSDSNLTFSSEIFWKLLATLMLRWLYLLPWSLTWRLGDYLIQLGSHSVVLNSNHMDSFSLALIVLGGLLYLLGLFLAIVKQYSYTLADYLLYDHLLEGNYPGAVKLLAESHRLMKGYRWKLFCLEISFIGWHILSGLTLGLLNFYVLPYTTTAHVLFYEHRLQLEKDDSK